MNCATCHQGAYQPLLGANMLADYPNLSKLAPAPEAADSIKDAMEEAVEDAMDMVNEMESASLDRGASTGEAH